MTKENTIDLIMNILMLYPNWKFSEDVSVDSVIDAWHKYLKDIDKDHAEKALDEYVTIERNVYAPSVSDIINLAKRYKPDPRFEGIEYWENRIKGIYPYAWDFVAFREWYTTDREAQRFYNYLKDGIGKAERGEIPETALNNFADVLKIYEVKKCLVMKKD